MTSRRNDSQQEATQPSSCLTYTDEERQFLGEEKVFVESLSSPYNVHRLALEGYLTDPKFLAYLNRVYERWSQPDWYRCLAFPLGLTYLEFMSKDPTFRQRALAVGFCREMQQLQERDLAMAP